MTWTNLEPNHQLQTNHEELSAGCHGRQCQMQNLNPVTLTQSLCHRPLLVSRHSLDWQQLFLYYGDICTLTVVPEKTVEFYMFHIPLGDNPLHKFWNKAEVRYRSIYEFTSASSSVGFFNLGRTIACFCDSGSLDDSRDALHKRLNTGARSAAAFFTSHVGAGSRQQCFPGSLASKSVTSLTATAWKLLSTDETGLGVMTGGGALAVLALIFVTLSPTRPVWVWWLVEAH